MFYSCVFLQIRVQLRKVESHDLLHLTDIGITHTNAILQRNCSGGTGSFTDCHDGGHTGASNQLMLAIASAGHQQIIDLLGDDTSVGDGKLSLGFDEHLRSELTGLQMDVIESAVHDGILEPAAFLQIIERQAIFADDAAALAGTAKVRHFDAVGIFKTRNTLSQEVHLDPVDLSAEHQGIGQLLTVDAVGKNLGHAAHSLVIAHLAATDKAVPYKAGTSRPQDTRIRT